MALNFCVCPLGNLDLSVVTTSVWYFWVKSLPSRRWIEQAKKRSVSSRLYKPWLFQLKAVPRLLVWLPPPALLERTALWFHCKLSMAKYPRIKKCSVTCHSKSNSLRGVSQSRNGILPTRDWRSYGILDSKGSSINLEANSKHETLSKSFHILLQHLGFKSILWLNIHTLNTKQTQGKWGHKKHVYLVCEQLNDFLYTVVHRHFSWL